MPLLFLFVHCNQRKQLGLLAILLLRLERFAALLVFERCLDLGGCLVFFLGGAVWGSARGVFMTTLWELPYTIYAFRRHPRALCSVLLVWSAAFALFMFLVTMGGAHDDFFVLLCRHVAGHSDNSDGEDKCPGWVWAPATLWQ